VSVVRSNLGKILSRKNMNQRKIALFQTKRRLRAIDLSPRVDDPFGPSTSTYYPQVEEMTSCDDEEDLCFCRRCIPEPKRMKRDDNHDEEICFCKICIPEPGIMKE